MQEEGPHRTRTGKAVTVKVGDGTTTTTAAAPKELHCVLHGHEAPKKRSISFPSANTAATPRRELHDFNE
jgi:hypothetical protein